MAITVTTAICRCISSAAIICCARGSESNQDAIAGALQEVERIVAQIRRRWHRVRIILRGDSGFCRDELMAWCEHNHVDYIFGLARNQRPEKQLAPAMSQAQQQHQSSGKAARVFAGFHYRTRKSWSVPGA